MLSWSDDLTRRGTVCHEKALLAVLSDDGSDEGAFDLYFRYFKRYCLTHANANVRSTEARGGKTERLARRSLYNFHNSRAPAFFDCSNWGVRLFFLLGFFAIAFFRVGAGAQFFNSCVIFFRT